MTRAPVAMLARMAAEIFAESGEPRDAMLNEAVNRVLFLADMLNGEQQKFHPRVRPIADAMTRFIGGIQAELNEPVNEQADDETLATIIEQRESKQLLLDHLQVEALCLLAGFDRIFKIYQTEKP